MLSICARMNDSRWQQLIATIKGDDVEAMVLACEALYKEADTSDVPRLLQLLENEDFVVREAAAWPLASVGGPEVLPELFLAYQRGFDDGHDNDGFTTALIELVELHPNDSRQKLLELKVSSNPIIQKYAEWLLQFS